MGTRYWITLSLPADSREHADAIAQTITADWNSARVVQVDSEPPQGAMIVGDHGED